LMEFHFDASLPAGRQVQLPNSCFLASLEGSLFILLVLLAHTEN
jgi:hypothetical protein